MKIIEFLRNIKAKNNSLISDTRKRELEIAKANETNEMHLKKLNLMEEKIAKAARFSQSVIDSMPVGMFVYEVNPPQMIDCNNELAKMLNAPKQQIIERYFQDFMPEYLPDGTSALDAAHKMGLRAMAGETVKTEWVHYTLDKTPMVCDVTLTRVKDAEEFIGLGFIYDMTEIRKREQELIQAHEMNKQQLATLDAANERFKIVLHSMPLVCNLWNRDGKIFDCNEAALKLFGMDKQTYMENLLKFTPEYQPNGRLSADMSHEMIEKAFTNGECAFEWVSIGASGLPFHFDVVLTRIEYEGEYILVEYSRDLREQKRMMKEVEDAQSTTFAMFDANPNVNILFNNRFEVIDCNNASLKFMGFETKEEMLNGFAERISKSLPKIQPDGRITTSLGERLMAAVENGVEIFETELHFPHRTSLFSVEFRKIPYEDSFAIIAFAQDISDTRRRELEIKNANETNEQQLTKLNLVIDATGIALWDMHVLKDDPVNPVNHIIYSDEYRYMLGYTDEKDLPNTLNSWDENLHPDDRERAVSAFSAHLLDKTGQTPYNIEYRLLKKNREYAYHHAFGKTVRDENGNPVYVAGAQMDVTETKKTIINNEMQLMKMALINKAAGIGLWDMEIIRDDPTNIRSEVAYSNEFRDIFGYTDENDFPNSLESFTNCLDPDALQIMNNKLTAHLADPTGKTPFDPEYPAKKKNGEIIYIRAAGESIRDEQGNAIRTVGTVMDISKDKITLENTEKLRKEADEANKAKSTFLANMSHEIRTPLNAVIGLSDLILNTDNSLDEESRYRLDRINNAGVTLLNTVNDILDISKIESGKFELVLTTYDIPSMINDAVTQSILHRGEKPIEFVMNVDENLPVQLYGDELRIKQILNNFLSNAFKYTMAGAVELTVNCNREDEVVWLTFIICDTGIGIKPEDMENLFSDYIQVDMSANRKIVGTGLGLSIAKRLIELMNGEIKAESEYGKGSVFTVRFMQKYVNDDVIGSEAVESLKNFNYSDQKRRQFGEMTRISLPYARVLIVDDVVTNLDVAKGLMKPYGMKIDCVLSGQEAIEVMLDNRVRYDAIFMDHMMPGMDGIEAAQRIREIETAYAKNIPIIALTANAIVGNEEMFLQNGFQAFISKPIEITHLDIVIKEWVRDKEKEKLHSDELPAPVQATDKNWQALQKGVHGVDVKQGMSRFNGDKDSYLDVLRSYAKNTPPLLEASKEVDPENLKDYATIVHGIRGSSGGICANEVAELAESLENAAIAGNYEYIIANNTNFETTARLLISDILNMIVEIDADNLKPIKEKPESETLEKLRQACINYEMKSVDATLEELDVFEYQTDGELVTWLRENVEQMNFDEIIERLSGC